MHKPRKTLVSKNAPASRSLMVRMDDDSKRVLSQAAELRQISVSDYVRTVTIAQARKELHAAQAHIISLTADEQLAFWKALNKPPKLTQKQKELSQMMRGKK